MVNPITMCGKRASAAPVGDAATLFTTGSDDDGAGAGAMPGILSGAGTGAMPGIDISGMLAAPGAGASFTACDWAATSWVHGSPVFS